jgi:hydrogenase/urease accessory protein HupE
VGLQATITDVLVRVQMLDGAHSTTLVRPSEPWVDIVTSQGSLAVAGAYVAHGIEHILLGVDHLLFVLGLVLLVNNRWMLIKTITAFTLAHSITLALATFGYVSIPVPPLNAAIALSILFLGPEIMRARRGGSSLTIRQPWIVAFAFGLLHGFGFASGLAQMGLPQNDIPLALFSFNIGVELGQLGFVALVLLLEKSLANVRRTKKAVNGRRLALGRNSFDFFCSAGGGLWPITSASQIRPASAAGRTGHCHRN